MLATKKNRPCVVLNSISDTEHVVHYTVIMRVLPVFVYNAFHQICWNITG